MLKYLILGRIGSGREFFQKLLIEQGHKIARSATNREKKDNNDNSHYFITDEEMANIKNPILHTVHNGYDYCYTYDEIEASRFIPIDPENVKPICEMFPEITFRAIEIMASNDERIKHSVTDADDKLIAETDFIAACEEENKAFCEFEDAVAESKINIQNLTQCHFINNDFTDSADIFMFAQKMQSMLRIYDRTEIIIQDLCENGLLKRDNANKNVIIPVGNEDVAVPTNLITEVALHSSESIETIMTLWLTLDKPVNLVS